MPYHQPLHSRWWGACAITLPLLTTAGAAKIWNDGAFGIPHPAPSILMTALLGILFGIWAVSAPADRRVGEWAIGSALLLFGAVTQSLLLLILARGPCERCAEVHPLCCEGWAMVLAMPPASALAGFSLALVLGLIWRTRMASQEPDR